LCGPRYFPVSKLRRPFLWDRYFFITVRLLRRRVKMTDGDFALLAQAFNGARAGHRLLLAAWVFLPDHGHAIGAPRYPETISRVVKSVQQSSTMAIHRRRAAPGEVWQPRFFDRALRTVKESNEKVASIHLNPVRAGLVRRTQEWPWSSGRESSGSLPEEATRHPLLPADRVLLPADERTRI
jgi:putative transposase